MHLGGQGNLDPDLCVKMNSTRCCLNAHKSLRSRAPAAGLGGHKEVVPAVPPREAGVLRVRYCSPGEKGVPGKSTVTQRGRSTLVRPTDGTLRANGRLRVGLYSAC